MIHNRVIKRVLEKRVEMREGHKWVVEMQEDLMEETREGHNSVVELGELDREAHDRGVVKMWEVMMEADEREAKVVHKLVVKTEVAHNLVVKIEGAETKAAKTAYMAE